MDVTDTAIKFDENGVCDHCNSFHKYTQPKWHIDQRGLSKLEAIIEKVRTAGRGREFDCILGLSGGLDSSYMLHLLVKKFELRPLVFHVDGGWNTDLAVNNIQVLVEKLNLDLFTEVIDWEDMRDLQLAFFKSGVSMLDVPQDHAFVAVLYKFANKHGVNYIMNGGNISTECVRNPLEWLYYGTDMWLINDIRARFCTRPLSNFPFSSVFSHKVYLKYIKKVKVIRALNYLPYTKEIAIKTLREEYGWRSYPQKHFESRFTRFFEGYWLPTRFGYDTRKVQFSSLILTGQMTRAEAIDARLARFEQIQGRQLALHAPPDADASPLRLGGMWSSLEAIGSRPVRPGVLPGGRPSGGQPDWTPPDQMETTGRLATVISRRPDAPRWALVDGTNNVLVFVTPQPGVNLAPLVGQQVTVRGSKGYMPEYKRPYLVAYEARTRMASVPTTDRVQ
jgi:N-acetyl sugar amidotransferase